jgi:RimJ/RimL family protein N-acetyltransferase
VVLRRDLAQDGPGVLYVATAPDGGPIYAQWLVRPRDREALYRHSPGRYSELGDEDVLVEGAYTFLAFRRRGAMADGMAQLLQIAADEGMHTAYTYVEVHNIPSLRGCAEVGFTPHHMRASVRRLGLRRGSELPVTDEDREVWDAATR